MVAATVESPNRLKISIVDLTFIIWILAIPLAFGARSLNVDGDLPRHLTMGEFVLRGGMYGIDTFAYTKSGPYEGMEWLSQVIFALAHRAGGLAAVVIVAALVISTAIALAVLLMRRAGVDPLLAYLAGMIAAVGTSAHWVPRPHIFTFLLLVLLLLLLESGARRRAWLFIPMFAFWANLHGMFILGFAVTGAWSAGAFAEAMRREGPDRKPWLDRARFGLTGIALGLVAVLLNPRGPGVLAGVTRCLGDAYIFQNTAEFQSLSFQTTYGRFVLLGILTIITAFALARERPSYPRLFVILLMLAGGLTSARMMPLFAIVGVPFLAVEFDAAWRRVRLPGRVARVRDVFAQGEQIARPGVYAPFAAVLVLALIPFGGNVAGVQVVENRFDAGTFPVEAVAFARENEITGRMYNDFVWGGYLLYAWPEQPIFIDGMTCFLGSDVMRAYMKIFTLDPGWRDEMERWDITVALVPAGSRVAAALLEGGDWQERYADGTAVLLQRDVGAGYGTARSGTDRNPIAGAETND